MSQSPLIRLLALFVLFLGGCLSTSQTAGEHPTETQTAAAKPGSATRILDIAVREESRGTLVALKADGPLPYKLFVKNDPPRILLAFPGIGIDTTIQPRVVNLSGLIGLFPAEAPDKSGGQLELTLPGMLEYDLKEHPTGLDLTILAKNRQAASSRPEISNASITRVQEGTEIRFSGSGPYPEPRIFRTNDPPRMVVDLMGMAGPGESRAIPAATPEATGAQLVSAPGKTRLIVELADTGITYRVSRDREQPVIHLSHRPDATGRPEVVGVTFARDGEDAVTRIQLDREGSAAQSQRQGTNLTLVLKKTAADPKWIRRMDVREFGGPVAFIDLAPDGENLVTTLRLNQDAGQHEILQKEQTLLVRVKSTLERGGKEAELPYSGQKVSLDVKDIDIQNALRFMAEIAKINIILSDSVTGTLTMRIADVPWDQALDLMLEAKGLGKIRQGNVLRVAPLSEIQKSTEARITEQNSKKQLEPVVTEMIPVSFAQADKIKTLLQEGDQAKGTRILSSQGSVSLDERTNTLIVKDAASNLAQIRDMVGKLDRPTPQVLIEARIVEVTREHVEELGINWGFSYKKNNSFGLSNSIANAYSTQQAATTEINSRARMSSTAPSSVKLLNISPNLGFHLGSISPLLDLDIELGAMETARKLKNIASPRILTINNQAATIRQGVKQQFLTGVNQSTGLPIYSAVQADLELNVTPQVTPNQFITLKLKATKNSLGVAQSGSLPPINTREIETQALVQNGDTIVLGGIYENTDNNLQDGIPELSKIPFLGWLFKNKYQFSTQTELLVFLTPRIIDPRP